MSEDWTPRDFQIDDLAAIMRDRRFGLLHDPGVGKTPPVCMAMWWNWNDRNRRSVWSMPKSLLAKNKAELLRFTHFSEDEVKIVDGTVQKRTKAYQDKNVKVFLMGMDCFSREWRQLLDNHRDIEMHVVDEIHKGYGSNNSKRTQNFYIAMRKIPYFVPMTGTLVNGRLDSVYPMIHVIEPRYYASYGQFLAEHAITDYYGTIIGWQNHDKIKAILARHCHRKTFEEVYGKESKVIIPIPIEMSATQRAVYQEFHDKAVLELDDVMLDGTLPGVHTIRCRQIMQCPEVLGIKINEPLPKDEILAALNEEALAAKERIIHFSVFIPEQERLLEMCQKQGMRAALMNGKVSSSKRGKLDEALRGGELDALICSAEVAAFGYNWSCVDTMTFPSVDYQDSSFLQAYRRAIRGVRTKPLRIYIPQYMNSVDQRLFQIVERKSQDAQKVDSGREVFRLGAAVAA